MPRVIDFRLMKRLVGSAISITVFGATAWANWNDTSTGIDLKSLPAFPLTRIRAGFLKEGERVRFDGMTAKMADAAGLTGEVVLQGTAKSSKTWAVHFSWTTFDAVYRGDLDGNGTQDYIVFGGSGANGRTAPPWSMIVLLTEKDGRPNPFEAYLYDELGPRHVVDLLHNGSAQLVDSAYDEDPWDSPPGAFCSGHWTTHLLEAADLKWSRFRGVVAGLAFPVVHRWTYGPTCDPQSQPQIANEQVGPDKDPAAMSDITSARIVSVGRSGTEVRLSPGSACESVSVGTIVYDDRSRREIALQSLFGPTNYWSESAQLTEVAVRDIYKTGSGFCLARSLWATE